MNVLFITSSRIGDAVLSTGLLDHIARKYPQAKVTVVCGPLTQSLFAGYPNLEKIIPLKKQKFNRHWFDLWREVAKTRWDMVVDLRNSAVSRVIPARQRFIFGPKISQKLHKVEQCAAVMKLDYVPAPKLWFTQKQMDAAEKLIPYQSSSPGLSGGSTGVQSMDPPHKAGDDGIREYILGVGPTANWLAKTWPPARFIEIVQFITDEIMPDARVAVFGAPGEEEGAYKVFDSVPKDKRIDVIAKADPGTVAAALSRCSFYIGNDSGLMHCAAAAGVPTLGLFGPSYPHLYRPWGPHCDFARTPESFDQLIDYKGYDPKTAPCLMTSLSVADVKEKLRKL